MSEDRDDNSIKTEMNTGLWDEVQLLAESEIEDKKKCVQLICANRKILPDEADLILENLASSGIEEIKIKIAQCLANGPHISLRLYMTLIDILRHDASPEIQRILHQQFQLRDNLTASFESIREMREQYSLMTQRLRDVITQTSQRIIKMNWDFNNNIKTGLSRGFINQLVEFNNVNQAISKMVLNYSPSFYTSFEIQETLALPELEENPLVGRIDSCPPGRNNWREYQSLVGEVLEYILVPPLTPPTEESPTETGLHKRDLIFHIPFDTSAFWNWIRNVYSAIGIIVDSKNYRTLLPPNEMVINAKYFGERKIGVFGIIVTRQGLTPSARREQIRLWRDEGKMIICINDEDLKKMIALKDEDGQPEIILDSKIRQLRESIE